MTRITDMTTGSASRHILRFALPLIVTNIGQQLYTIVDAAIVGRGVGVQALASVGTTDWAYWLILWSVGALTQGFATFVSRYFGEKNYEMMNRTVAMSAILAAVIGLAATVLGLLMSRPVLLMLNTPADILDGATTYLSVMLAGTLIVTAYNVTGAILRALGDGKTPLAAMAIASTLNICLDLLFVFVFHWGIVGAAVASVISQLVAFLYCLSRLLKVECICLSREMWRMDFRLIGRMLRFGLPLAFQHVVIALGGIFVQSSINLQGSAFIAGYTATNKVYGMLECSSIALGASCATFFAQNYGAKHYQRLKRGVNLSVGIVLAMAAFVMTVALIFREPLMHLFLDANAAGGAQALDIAVRYLVIITCCLPILYLIHVYRNVLQGMGISIWSMYSGIAELIARLFMAKVAIQWLGSDALFIAEPVAWLGALLLVMLPYYGCRGRVLGKE